jgi:Saposin-like type B, region 2
MFQIESALNGWCDLLTGIEESCKNFVAEQLPVVIDLLVNEYLNPEEVCFNLYLCP